MSTREFYISLTRLKLPANEPKINRLTRSQSAKLTTEKRLHEFISLETLRSSKTKNCDDQMKTKSQFGENTKDEEKKQSKHNKKKGIPKTTSLSSRCKDETIKKSESSYPGKDEQGGTKDAQSDENVKINTTSEENEYIMVNFRGKNDNIPSENVLMSSGVTVKILEKPLTSHKRKDVDYLMRMRNDESIDNNKENFRANSKERCSKRKPNQTNDDRSSVEDKEKNESMRDEKTEIIQIKGVETGSENIQLRKLRSRKTQKQPVDDGTNKKVTKISSKRQRSELDSNSLDNGMQPKKRSRTLNSESQAIESEEKLSNQAKQIAHCFKVGEVVWAKLRGFPCWPARIEKIIGDKKQLIEIFWFNDYRKSKVYRSQIFNFHDNFSQFSKEFESHVGLETAAKEALIYLARKS